MKVFNKKYCLIKKKYYICITKLITHLKINKMRIQLLLKLASNKLLNGYSESSIVQFVFENANNDIQAKVILQNVLNCK